MDKTIPGWETLLCLFLHGPTWDGNVPSKSERDECFRRGHIARGDGYQWLTEAGMFLCLKAGFGAEKERRESRKRHRLALLEEENERLRRIVDAQVEIHMARLAGNGSESPS